MPITQPKRQKKNAKATGVEKAMRIPSGWDTTDEDEIQRRRQRAETEDMTVKGTAADTDYFNTYSVTTSMEKCYTVEIRSLIKHINSCSCADYDTNGLGTCKHIEKVLLTLEKKGSKKFQDAGNLGSPRAEIFVNPSDEKIQLVWPHNQIVHLDTRRLLSDFFCADGSLVAEASTAIPAIKRLVQYASDVVRSDIRISNRIEKLLTSTNNSSQKQASKECFLQDVTEGKRSLDIVNLPLYEYQHQGMLHLAFTERAILADEMGLGKTVQAVAACELLRKLHGIGKVLVISPTSLKAEWEEQINKFISAPTTLVFGNRMERLRQYQTDSMFYLTNYEQILRDQEEIQRLMAPDVIILDEAQRIKNWRTKTAATVKELRSRYAFVLTGTPIENRIDDIYSIVQFLDPKFFGPLFRFNREFYQLDDNGKPTGYKNLDVLHERLRPILLRRLKGDVEGQLPDRTVNTYFVKMEEEQQARYDDYGAIVARLATKARKHPLRKEESERLQRSLACMRMLCDTTYILDQDLKTCPKLHELANILEELLQDNTTKIIIFSEWERMLFLVRELLEKMGIAFAWHTGSVDQKKRRDEINRFKEDAACKVFLSTDAGSVGLNLQVANVVINLDLPWNPAKLEQRIARAWRKHQTRAVQVINLVSEDTIEHRMLGLLKLKQQLANNVLDSGDLGEMELPSGRAALMDQLDEILGTSAPPARQPSDQKNKADQDPLTIFGQDTIARFEPRLHQLEAYKDDEGKKTIFAVVDGDITQPQQQMRDTLEQLDQSPPMQLEVLDRATYETIQRLCKAGILSFNQDHASLYQSKTKVASRQEERQKRAHLSQKYLTQTERKQRMAALLIDGEFYDEALAPLRDVFDLVVKAFATLVECKFDNKKTVPLELVEQELVAKAGLAKQAITVAQQLQAKELSLEQQAVQQLSEQIKQIYQFVEEQVNKP
ncbi:MAG: DEAD/DEAH box helicase [Pseudomonadota bacterium]